MNWPWSNSTPSYRRVLRAYLPGHDFTTGSIEGMELQLNANDAGVTRLAVVEAALGIVSRPFMAATVEPDDTVDGNFLSGLVRTLALQGDVCYELVVMTGGKIGFRRFTPDKITGPIENRRAWMYHRKGKKNLMGEDVVHFTWALGAGERTGQSLLARTDKYYGTIGHDRGVVGVWKKP